MSKFFSYEERLHLQSNLKEGLPFKEISRRLEKDPSTISREVRNYSSEIATGYPGQTHNTCKNRRTCTDGESAMETALEASFTVKTVVFVIKAVLTM